MPRNLHNPILTPCERGAVESLKTKQPSAVADEPTVSASVTCERGAEQNPTAPDAASDVVARILAAMSREQRSLLLYLETCAVDACGIVDTVRMNAADFDIAKAWHRDGFIKFVRLLSRYLPEPRRESYPSHVVELTNESFACAALERRNRAGRMRSPKVAASIAHREKGGES